MLLSLNFNIGGRERWNKSKLGKKLTFCFVLGFLVSEENIYIRDTWDKRNFQGHFIQESDAL